MFKQVPQAVFYKSTSSHSVIIQAAVHAACSHLLHAAVTGSDDFFFFPVFSYSPFLLVELTVASCLVCYSVALGHSFAGVYSLYKENKVSMIDGYWKSGFFFLVLQSCLDISSYCQSNKS